MEAISLSTKFKYTCIFIIDLKVWMWIVKECQWSKGGRKGNMASNLGYYCIFNSVLFLRCGEKDKEVWANLSALSFCNSQLPTLSNPIRFSWHIPHVLSCNVWYYYRNIYNNFCKHFLFSCGQRKGALHQKSYILNIIVEKRRKIHCLIGCIYRIKLNYLYIKLNKHNNDFK